MSWSLAAVSCDNYGAVHSFLNGVFSVLCTYKLREELKLPPEVPSGPRPIVRAESGPISAVVFFSSAHLPQESSLSPSKGPPTPSNVWVGFGLCQQPPGSLPGWDRPGSCHPRRGTWPWSWKGPEALLAAGTREGLGGSDLSLGRQPYPTWRSGRTLGSNNALRPQCHLPLSFRGEEPGAGGDQDPSLLQPLVGRARGPFKFPFRRPS